MNINITSRHAAMTDALKAHVYAKLSSVLQEYPPVENAHVVLETQRFRHSVEVIVQVKNQLNVEAKETTDDMYKSVDQVADKLDRQLRRFREKQVNHKGNRHRVKLADFEQTLERTP